MSRDVAGIRSTLCRSASVRVVPWVACPRTPPFDQPHDETTRLRLWVLFRLVRPTGRPVADAGAAHRARAHQLPDDQRAMAGALSAGRCGDLLLELARRRRSCGVPDPGWGRRDAPARGSLGGCC